MRRYLLLSIIALLGFGTAHAQPYYGVGFDTWQDMPCPYDPGVTVRWPGGGWQFYFTQDNTWNGPIDSTLCVSFYPSGTNHHRLDTVNWPAGKRLFLRAPIPLNPGWEMPQDWIYAVHSPISVYSCDNIPCNRVLVRQEIPDPAGTGTVILEQEYVNQSIVGGEFCHVTEKFETHRVTEVIMSVERPNYQSYFQVNNQASLNMEPLPDVQPLPVLNEAYPQGSDYWWYANGMGWGGQLVRYNEPYYPAPDSISYTEFVPVDDPTDSAHIIVYVDSWSSFHFQRYTALRGALVNGSDSIRHSVDLQLQGNMCFPMAEVIWEGGNQLTVDGGSLHFHDQKSCMQFGHGGKLKVRSGTTLRYGEHGIGMMALRTGAQIEMEPGAELVMQGTVVMYEYNHETTPQQIYLDLVPGAKLTFAPGARLTNEYAIDRHMRLNVRMLGGELDDSGLSPDDRALINRIYAFPSTVSEENLQLYPSPVSDEVGFLYVSTGAGEVVIATITDLQGRIVAEEHLRTANQGHNRMVLPFSSARPGIYTLSLTSRAGVLNRRFIKVG
jgi:hypothetical protein